MIQNHWRLMTSSIFLDAKETDKWKERMIEAKQG